jgi:biotin carboxyl carrier protein
MFFWRRMKLKIQFGRRTCDLEFTREGRQLRATLDGRPIEADAVETGPGQYSLLLEGAACEVYVEPAPAGLIVSVAGRRVEARVVDPRRWRGGGRGGALELEGRQQVLAPMPGKVVRVLVQQGEKVEAGRGLLVVEAMKMQNEIRAPKTGAVERLLVAEGQAVNAGEVLAVVA